MRLLLLVAGLWLAAPAFAGQYEGDPCYHAPSRRAGMCKLLPYCSWAVKERRSGIYPQHCSFRGFLPVVCCPYTRTHDPEPALEAVDGVAMVLPLLPPGALPPGALPPGALTLQPGASF